MIIKSKTNEGNYIEIKDRITAGIRERYKFMQNPKITYNANGEMAIDTSNLTEYESNPNLYLMSKCITKIIEDGKDKTPKSSKLSDLIQLLDEDFYDIELFEKAIETALEQYHFLEEKPKKIEKE